MKRIGQGKYWMIWLGIIAYVSLTVVSLPGMVFCIEQNGHIALETAVNGICSDAWQGEREVQKSLSIQTTLQTSVPCKHCVDVPINMISAGNSGYSIQAFAPIFEIPVVSQSSPVLRGYLATITPSRMPHPPPPRALVHRYLSTVRLLI